MTLISLYEECPDTSSDIVYYDGVRKVSMSYAELQVSILEFSSFLEAIDVSKCFVCCLIKPNISLCTIIIGILKTSSSFAFLDSDRPIESLKAFQKHLPINTVLVEDVYFKNLQSLCCCWKKIDEINLDPVFIILKSEACTNDKCPNFKNSFLHSFQPMIAYAVQTSGTTGVPKVVQVPHECIIPNIIDLKSRFSVSTEDVILQSTRLTFDPCIIEIFLALSSGASMIIIDNRIRSVPKQLQKVIIDNKITVLQATPSLVNSLGDEFLKDILLSKESVLRVLAFGGEICPSINKLQRWKSEENSTELYNLYGITEVSCWASCHKIEFKRINSSTSVPLGEPLLNTKFHIYNEITDITDKGELFIGGFKRFCIINDEQWPENPDNFMRPTGDLVYQSTEGAIYFEGRNDLIFKYKGHKISLHLINNIVEMFFEVQNHILHFDSSTEKLYLFIVWNSNFSQNMQRKESEILKCVKKSVLHLPAIIVLSVPFIPMTPHGKADQKKLLTLLNKKRPFYIQCYKEVFEAMWKEYTNQSHIEENDNFFLKGCDSILAVQLASDFEWRFQTSLPLLVEKLLNENYKDILTYIDCNFNKIQQEKPDGESELIYQMPDITVLKKQNFDFNCYRVSYKHGYFEKCCHPQKICFSQNILDTFHDTQLEIRLEFKIDLKKCIDATPCVLHLNEYGNLIFIGSHFGQFSCISVDKKAEIWSIFLPDRIESSACITACGNYVLFGCYDHNLYCVCLLNGSIHWKMETKGVVKSSPSVCADNTAFVGSHDKHVYAANVEDGHTLWKKQIAFGSIFSSPLVIEELESICVATLDGVIALLKMKSGDVMWQYDSKTPLFSTALSAFDSIYVGSTGSALLCFSLHGKLKYEFPTSKPVFSSAAFHKDVLEERIVFGCHDCYVYCITQAGQLVWKTLCDSAIYATPFVFKRKEFYICVASSKGTLYILRQNDGKVVHSWLCPGEVFSSPIILDDYLVVGCRDNNVYCFNIINSASRL